MQLSPLYLEKIAAAEQLGRLQERRAMVLLFLAQKFDSLPADLLARVESLSFEQLQLLTSTIPSLSSVVELSTWLDTSKISDS